MAGKKKDVVLLSTIHEASFVETLKVDREGNKIEKPEAVYYYCSRMGGVDLSDQLFELFYIFTEKHKMVTKIIDTSVQFSNTECLHFEQALWFKKRNVPG